MRKATHWHSRTTSGDNTTPPFATYGTRNNTCCVTPCVTKLGRARLKTRTPFFRTDSETTDDQCIPESMSEINDSAIDSTEDFDMEVEEELKEEKLDLDLEMDEDDDEEEPQEEGLVEVAALEGALRYPEN